MAASGGGGGKGESMGAYVQQQLERWVGEDDVGEGGKEGGGEKGGDGVRAWGRTCLLAFGSCTHGLSHNFHTFFTLFRCRGRFWKLLEFSDRVDKQLLVVRL